MGLPEEGRKGRQMGWWCTGSAQTCHSTSGLYDGEAHLSSVFISITSDRPRGAALCDWNVRGRE